MNVLLHLGKTILGPTGCNFFAVVKSFDANIAIIGNFAWIANSFIVYYHLWTVPEDTVPTNVYTNSYLSHHTVQYGTQMIPEPCGEQNSCVDASN